MDDEEILFVHDVKIGDSVIAHIVCEHKEAAIRTAVRIANMVSDLTGYEVEITNVDHEDAELAGVDVEVERVH